MKNYYRKIYNRLLSKKHKTRSLNDLPYCKELDLDEDMLNQKMLDDKFSRVYRSKGVTIPVSDFNEIDPNFEGSGLTIMREEKSYKLKKNKNVIKVKDEVLSEMFYFFEKTLLDGINTEFYKLTKEHSDYISKFEESKKRDASFFFFRSLYERLPFLLKRTTRILPQGINENNLLSKMWIYEGYLIEDLFRQNKPLIVRYLYCRNSLQDKNIYGYYSPLVSLIEFSAIRKWMLELNNIYKFEESHPYTKQITLGLIFENFDDLFMNKKSFDWTVETILSQTDKTTSFYNEITKVLKDEKLLKGNFVITRFQTFLRDNFDCDVPTLRPKESTKSKKGKNRFDALKEELNVFLKN